jgi:hypothetical protein
MLNLLGIKKTPSPPPPNRELTAKEKYQLELDTFLPTLFNKMQAQAKTIDTTTEYQSYGRVKFYRHTGGQSQGNDRITTEIYMCWKFASVIQNGNQIDFNIKWRDCNTELGKHIYQSGLTDLPTQYAPPNFVEQANIMGKIWLDNNKYFIKGDVNIWDTKLDLDYLESDDGFNKRGRSQNIDNKSIEEFWKPLFDQFLDSTKKNTLGYLPQTESTNSPEAAPVAAPEVVSNGVTEVKPGGGHKSRKNRKHKTRRPKIVKHSSRKHKKRTHRRNM